MEALREGLSHKELLRLLSNKLAGRTMTQIRAHHQKMMNKFGGVENILKVYPSQKKASELFKIS